MIRLPTLLAEEHAYVGVGRWQFHAQKDLTNLIRMTRIVPLPYLPPGQIVHKDFCLARQQTTFGIALCKGHFLDDRHRLKHLLGAQKESPLVLRLQTYMPSPVEWLFYVPVAANNSPFHLVSQPAEATPMPHGLLGWLHFGALALPSLFLP